MEPRGMGVAGLWQPTKYLHYIHCFTFFSFQNCVPSHMFSTDELLPSNTRLEAVRLQNSFLAKEIVDIKDQVLTST